MKTFIALPLLAAAASALAAPQPAARADAKTFKEPARDRDDCYKKDPSMPWRASATLIEDCTGTLEYCLRGYYAQHDEQFADADACLTSRGVDPATAIGDAIRIVNRDEYRQGFQALHDANHLINRHRLLVRLERELVSPDRDPEGDKIVENIWRSKDRRAWAARKAIADAKEHFGGAFAPGHEMEIAAAIKDAEDRLNASWDEVDGKDFGQISGMWQWFTSHTEEKYYYAW
ncbi:hypothetical protein ISF_00027 [Cordyceps fumosorosea ARSEF 2679]|uniref:Uncharacterized protein n=1 Tax=Cordyceps fumosorosea (strain ARSEF 2679) TaxID=1081104 RepID=A0A168DXI2_CORFA|nr:hypothetical protein ISF_00027 [Cordyceps fumosorosea ARSEF 2679]OAA73126.1 hypothetical protein ISF_00027 [Cordyceps fumosorosea ARSEF 2679]